jgi:hypothetical protein
MPVRRSRQVEERAADFYRADDHVEVDADVRERVS